MRHSQEPFRFENQDQRGTSHETNRDIAKNELLSASPYVRYAEEPFESISQSPTASPSAAVRLDRIEHRSHARRQTEKDEDDKYEKAQRSMRRPQARILIAIPWILMILLVVFVLAPHSDYLFHGGSRGTNKARFARDIERGGGGRGEAENAFSTPRTAVPRTCPSCSEPCTTLGMEGRCCRPISFPRDDGGTGCSPLRNKTDATRCESYYDRVCGSFYEDASNHGRDAVTWYLSQTAEQRVSSLLGFILTEENSPPSRLKDAYEDCKRDVLNHKDGMDTSPRQRTEANPFKTIEERLAILDARGASAVLEGSVEPHPSSDGSYVLALRQGSYRASAVSLNAYSEGCIENGDREICSKRLEGYRKVAEKLDSIQDSHAYNEHYEYALSEALSSRWWEGKEEEVEEEKEKEEGSKPFVPEGAELFPSPLREGKYPLQWRSCARGVSVVAYVESLSRVAGVEPYASLSAVWVPSRRYVDALCEATSSYSSEDWEGFIEVLSRASEFETWKIHDRLGFSESGETKLNHKKMVWSPSPPSSASGSSKRRYGHATVQATELPFFFSFSDSEMRCASLVASHFWEVLDLHAGEQEKFLRDSIVSFEREARGPMLDHASSVVKWQDDGSAPYGKEFGEWASKKISNVKVLVGHSKETTEMTRKMLRVLSERPPRSLPGGSKFFNHALAMQQARFTFRWRWAVLSPTSSLSPHFEALTIGPKPWSLKPEAYYSYRTNSVVFTDAMLDHPFLAVSESSSSSSHDNVFLSQVAINYFYHEVSHALDRKGVNYDHDLSPRGKGEWKGSDRLSHEEHMACLSDVYGGPSFTNEGFADTLGWYLAESYLISRKRVPSLELYAASMCRFSDAGDDHHPTNRFRVDAQIARNKTFLSELGCRSGNGNLAKLSTMVSKCKIFVGKGGGRH